MFFESNKLNPANENYGSTITIIINLLFLAKMPKPLLIMYHLEQNLTVSYLSCWSTDLTEKKLLNECTTRGRCKPTKHKKPSLHVIGLTRELVTYKWCISGIHCYHSSSFFKKVWFILCTFSNSYLNYGKIVEILERT